MNKEELKKAAQELRQALKGLPAGTGGWMDTLTALASAANATARIAAAIDAPSEQTPNESDERHRDTSDAEILRQAATWCTRVPVRNVPSDLLAALFLAEAGREYHVNGLDPIVVALAKAIAPA